MATDTQYAETDGQQITDPSAGATRERETVSTSTETSTGTDENVLGALSYVLGFVTGLIVYLIEKDNEFARFHAAQSMVVSGGLLVLSIATSVLGTIVSTFLFTSTSGFFVGSLVSLVFGLLWLVVSVGSFVLWAYLIISTFQGKTPRVPVAAGIADGLV